MKQESRWFLAMEGIGNASNLTGKNAYLKHASKSKESKLSVRIVLSKDDRIHYLWRIEISPIIIILLPCLLILSHKHHSICLPKYHSTCQSCLERELFSIKDECDVDAWLDKTFSFLAQLHLPRVCSISFASSLFHFIRDNKQHVFGLLN